MKSIKQSYFINSSIDKVWDALINPDSINAWGGGPAKMGGKVGTKFSLWGGSIWGTNTKVVTQKELVQDWYSDEKVKWEKPSVATFTLAKKNNGVELSLLHQDIPDLDAENIDQGWKDYYLGPLKDYLESNKS